MTLEQATEQANQFLSTILGPDDSRQPAKADELAQIIMAAAANGKSASLKEVLKKK